MDAGQLSFAAGFALWKDLTFCNSAPSAPPVTGCLKVSSLSHIREWKQEQDDKFTFIYDLFISVTPGVFRGIIQPWELPGLSSGTNKSRVAGLGWLS